MVDDVHISGFQIKIVAECMKNKIAPQLKAILQNISGVKSVNFDRVKLAAADFQEFELPAVQVYDVAETVTHEQSRAKKEWQLAIEIIMKPTERDVINQSDLWNLQYSIERALWKDPRLGVGSGMIHIKYLGAVTDLHLLEPFYICRMDVVIIFYEHLVQDC